MDDEEIENTSVIRMKRDLDTFLSGSISRADFPRFKLRSTGNDSNLSSTSMQTLIDKDRENQLKSAEIVAAKGQITKLESILLEAETSSKRSRLSLENEVEILRAESKAMRDTAEDMKVKLEYLIDKEQDTRDELNECVAELRSYKTSHEDKNLGLEKDVLHIEGQLRESQDGVSELELELSNVRGELYSCQGELEDVRNQLDHQLQLNESQKEEIKELELYRDDLRKAELSIRDLENQLEKHQDEITLTKAHKTQLDDYPTLKKQVQTLQEENELLKSNDKNSMILELELEGLQKKLDRASDRIKELSKLEIESDELRNRLKKWESFKVPGSKQPQCPSDLLKHIADLQSSQISQLEKQGELNTSMRRSEEEVKEYKVKYLKTQEKLDLLTIDCQKQSVLIKHLQRKLLLVTKERDGYKKIIESYESEITMNLADPNIGRIQQLESLITSCQRQTEALETEKIQQLEQITQLQNKSHMFEMKESHSRLSIGTPGESLVEDKLKILELGEKVIMLETQVKKVEEEKFILETRLEQKHLQGDYDPTKTKILHFTMNPAAKAQQKQEEDVELLRKENEKLRRRVEILENAEGQVDDLTEQVEEKLQQPSPNKQVEEMKAQVKREELRNKRLMEAFKKTSQEFREVCCQITGYKIDITGTNQYRLTSMFAESTKDYLLFQQTSDGNIEMLETEFSETVQDLIDLYLVNQDSVPAFLSGVTLNLFQTQTMNLG